MRTFVAALLVSLISTGTAIADKDAKKLVVTSPAFRNGSAIPSDLTCDGSEKSPPLAWAGAPDKTRSFAILVDDPDAPKGTFTHWLVTRLPASTTSLADDAALPGAAVTAKNDKGLAGYAGPCPPSGKHHYHFRVYALDTTLPAGLTRAKFLKAIKGHVLAQGDLVGTYRRHPQANL